MSEVISMIVVMGAGLLALRAWRQSNEGLQKSLFSTQMPSTEKEPDVTRWRHDGSQPLEHHDGNRKPMSDEAATMLYHDLGRF